MCGIFAFLDLENKVNVNTLETMSHSIAHRGPDDNGYAFFEIFNKQQMFESKASIGQKDLEQFNGVLALGHRRLSIIDLTEAGHQPMCNESRRIWITYNGEIYNYKELTEELKGRGHFFKSSTDTEVILHAYEEWGIECLRRFNGMWAFALWDMGRKRLFCARDRFGIKPFYYLFRGQKFILASEIKAILQDPRVERYPTNGRLYDYLAYGFLDHTDETFFKDIYQLRGSHYLILEVDSENHLKLSVHPYWDLSPKEKEPRNDCKERFLEVLEDSIRLHMRSDVPIGTCLSGGLDSSSIVCVAERFLNSNIHKTFSSCFDDQKYDERNFISKVIEITHSEAHYVFPKAEDLFKEIEDLIWYQEEPFGSTSIYAQWNVFKLARLNQIKVVLDGQGADELLGGYHSYFGFYLSELIRRFQWDKFLCEYLKIRSLHGYSHQWLIRHLIFSFIPRQWFGAMRKRILLQKEKWIHFENYSPDRTASPRRFKNIFLDWLYQSLMNFSLPGLLHYEDRNSMAHSIEARVPFLDYRLVEFVFSLPINQFISNGVTKVVLRNAMKGILPEAVRNRKDKMGFVTPENIWLRDVLKDRILELIHSKSFGERGYVDPNEVWEIYDRHLKGERNYDSAIWRCVNLELWFRTFIDPSHLCDFSDQWHGLSGRSSLGG